MMFINNEFPLFGNVSHATLHVTVRGHSSKVAELIWHFQENVTIITAFIMCDFVKSCMKAALVMYSLNQLT